MELDEMKARWDALDQKLDESIRLNKRVVESQVTHGARGTLRWLSLGLAAELLLGAVALLWTGSSVVSHLSEPAFLLPGLLLHLFLIATVGSIVWQIVAVAQIDYSGPIVQIRKQVETVQVHRSLGVLGTLLVSPLMWAALIVVGLKALGGNAYEAVNLPWLAGNAVFGIVALAVGLWACNRFKDSPRKGRWLRELGGHNLHKARTALAEVEEWAA